MHISHITTDPEDGLPDEDVNAIDEIPVYSINKPKEESLALTRLFMVEILEKIEIENGGMNFEKSNKRY